MSDSPETTVWLRAMPVVFVLIWSTGFIVARYGMPYAPPFSFLLVRYICSILCFLPWIVLTRVAWPRDRAQWLHLSVTGILMHAGYLGGVWAAVKSGMGSGLSALIVGIQPVLTAIWLSWSLRGSGQPGVTPRQWGGLLLGFAGLLMVVWHKLTMGSALDHVTPVNMAFAIGALFSITVGTLYQKRFVQPCDVRSANTVQLLAAAVLTLPLAWLEPETMQWNLQLVGAMAWSVLGLTLGGSSLLYILIQRGAAASVTSLMYMVPPTTAIMAWVLFGETITVLTLAGTALTALGVSLVVRPARA
ncbi:DMT family transporter [Limnohabitans radicicola]|uniref:DMT family transporter n=1 Tax=Limnohabitans radicicola TaxID=2771427 RepID=A0A927FJI8_9BURK|nr:DMT family transporter [Limnohabitans radicicola]MBD8051238.1 DMT family transporter [Limnohabitans radicicola]